MWVGYHASIGGSVTDFTLRRNADGMSACWPLADAPVGDNRGSFRG